MPDTIASLKAEVKALQQEITELKSHEAQLELIMAATGVGIWDWYVQTNETIFNERWANIIGYTLEELSPVSIDTWLKYAHPEDLKESERLLNDHWSGKTDYYICESRMKHKSGQWVWVYDTGRVIEWESKGVPKRMIGTHLDITELKNTQDLLKNANKELETLVRIDPLSRIANRRAYDERLISELSVARREDKTLSLLMIDIDHFKQYNDLYGHEQGDLVIQTIAKCIQSTLSRKTDFVARYGGEEFVVLLPFTTPHEAKTVCTKLLQAIIKLKIKHDYSQFNKTLTISIGVSSTQTSPENILTKADKALYAAKQNGRNQYHIAAY